MLGSLTPDDCGRVTAWNGCAAPEPSGGSVPAAIGGPAVRRSAAPGDGDAAGVGVRTLAPDSAPGRRYADGEPAYCTKPAAVAPAQPSITVKTSTERPRWLTCPRVAVNSVSIIPVPRAPGWELLPTVSTAETRKGRLARAWRRAGAPARSSPAGCALRQDAMHLRLVRH